MGCFCSKNKKNRSNKGSEELITTKVEPKESELPPTDPIIPIDQDKDNLSNKKREEELIKIKDAPKQFELPPTDPIIPIDQGEDEVHQKQQGNIILPNKIDQKTENVLVHDEQGHEIENRINIDKQVESQNKNDQTKYEELRRSLEERRKTFFESDNDPKLSSKKPIKDTESKSNQNVKQGKANHNDDDVDGDKRGIADLQGGSMQGENTYTEGKNVKSYPMAETENRELKKDNHQLVITDVNSQDERNDLPVKQTDNGIELMEISQVTPEQHAENIQQNDCKPIETGKIDSEIDKNTIQDQKIDQVTESMELALNHLPTENEQILGDPQLNETAPCVSKDYCQQNCESVKFINEPDQINAEDCSIVSEHGNDISDGNNRNPKDQNKNKVKKSKQDKKKDKDKKSNKNEEKTPNNLNKSDNRDSYSSDDRYNQKLFYSGYREPESSYPQNNRDVGPPSLTNMGATCYLNSAFQGISACDTFVKEIDDLCNLYSGEGVTQLHVFKELIDILNGCSRNHMEISRNSIFRNWNKPGQQDSYELLAYALNQVYNQLRKHKENTKEIPKRDLKKWLEVKLPMRFIIQYEIKCGCGLTTYSPLQSDLALHVTIPSKEERCVLSKLVDLYFGNDPIEDYECDKHGCDGKNTNRIARLAKPLPHTICIHLQRTFWNGYAMKKINKPISFGTTLILKSEYWSKKEEPEATEINSNDIVKEEVTNNTDNQASTTAEDILVTSHKTEGAQGDVENGISVTITESIDLCNIGGDNLSNINNKDEDKDEHISSGDNYVVTTDTTDTGLPLDTNEVSTGMDVDGNSHVPENNTNVAGALILPSESEESVYHESHDQMMLVEDNSTVVQDKNNTEEDESHERELDSGYIPSNDAGVPLDNVFDNAEPSKKQNTEEDESHGGVLDDQMIVDVGNVDVEQSTINTKEDKSHEGGLDSGYIPSNDAGVPLDNVFDNAEPSKKQNTEEDESHGGVLDDQMIVDVGNVDVEQSTINTEEDKSHEGGLDSGYIPSNDAGVPLDNVFDNAEPSKKQNTDEDESHEGELDDQMIVDDGNVDVEQSTINTKENGSHGKVLDNEYIPSNATCVSLDNGSENAEPPKKHKLHDGVLDSEHKPNNATDEPLDNGFEKAEPPNKKSKVGIDNIGEVALNGDITKDSVVEMVHCDGSITCNGDNTAIVGPDQLSSDTTKGELFAIADNDKPLSVQTVIVKDVKPKSGSTKPVENDETYDLVSVIVHSGTVYGGHYICYKRVDDKWFLTNDSSVHEVSENNVLNCQAYILFYEQRYDDIHSVE